MLPLVNSNLKNARHFTIISITHTDARQYGFAVNDDGETVFIPPNVVRRHGLREEHEGVGFSAVTRPSSITPNLTSGKMQADMQVMLPIIFDPVDAPSAVPITADEALGRVGDDVSAMETNIDHLTAQLAQITEQVEILSDLHDRIGEVLDNIDAVTGKAR